MSSDNHSEYKQLTTKDWVGFFAMVIGLFMAILDIQIVASSISEIQSGLSATQEEISWIQTSYLIAEVLVIPITGWLARTFSTKILFSVSCAGFTFMSLLCACSWNINSMIIFRVFQGLCAAPMIPLIFSSIYIMFPRRLHNNMNIVVGLIVTIAPTTGPILGGYLTEKFSWHILFLLNVIPGTIATIAVWLCVDIDKPNLKLLEKIDFKGIALICLFLGPLQYVLEEGNAKDWFDSNVIIIFSAISLFSFIYLIYHELTIDEPIIDLRAFKNPNFLMGCVFSFAMGWGLFNAVFLQPLYLAAIKNLNSLQIGEYMMVAGIFQFVSAPIAGALSKKLDQRILLAIGIIIFSAGCYVNSNLSYDSGFWEFFIPQMLRGTSLMMLFMPINSIAFGTLSIEQVKNASGLYNLTRNLGGAIGLAVTNSLIQKWTKENAAILKESIIENSERVVEMISSLSAQMESYQYANPDQSAIKMLDYMVKREASIIAFNNGFILIAAIMFLSLIFMMFVEKVDPEKAEAASSAAH